MWEGRRGGAVEKEYLATEIVFSVMMIIKSVARGPVFVV